MNDKKNNQQKSNNFRLHLGTITIKGPGTYCGGVIKLRANPKKDLLDSAISFFKAADRCLNGCKEEEGIEMLTVPGSVCATFSCELFLKYILLVETGEELKGHNLADLFKKCSKEIQSALMERNKSILTILERNNTQFVEARYHHEKEVFSFCQTELLQTAELLSRFVAERYPNKKT
jgi:HEPN domain-containing protein